MAAVARPPTHSTHTHKLIPHLCVCCMLSPHNILSCNARHIPVWRGGKLLLGITTTRNVSRLRVRAIQQMTVAAANHQINYSTHITCIYGPRQEEKTKNLRSLKFCVKGFHRMPIVFAIWAPSYTATSVDRSVVLHSRRPATKTHSPQTHTNTISLPGNIFSSIMNG